MASGHKWKPLQRAVAKWPPPEELVQAWMTTFQLDRETAFAKMEEEHAKVTLWRNDLYQVEVHEMKAQIGEEAMDWVHLNIRRLDGYPGRDWRHFQQIKNELVGPECEGVEIYPAESRKVDTTNKYHLWCCRKPGFRMPFGWDKRDVDYNGTEAKTAGLRQAPEMQFAKSEEASHGQAG